MRLDDFQRMVQRMTAELPPEYLDGIAAVDVSPKTLPDPVRPDVYILGECIPIDSGSDHVTSRVVLYHGSFAALARQGGDFDWRLEAWETLTHELRHHLEWRARTDALEAYDWAAEQNFARLEGERFDPLFFMSGEPVAPGMYKVDDDYFIDRVVRRPPVELNVDWHGTTYLVPVPGGPLPMLLALDGLAHPPPGDVVVVVRRVPRFWDLFRRREPPTQVRVKIGPPRTV